MKICVATDAYDISWSSARFLAEGFLENKDLDVVVCGSSSKNIPDADLYIDIEGGHNTLLDRSKRPVCSIVLDIFDDKIDRTKKFEHARTADFVITMSEIDKRIVEERGTNVNGIITWGLYEKVWKKIDIEKDADIKFVGNTSRYMSNHRPVLLSILKSRGFIVKSSHKEHFLDGNAKFISGARIGLNIPNRGFNAINQRDTEIIGCELPLLTYGIDYFRHIIPNHLATFYYDEKDLPNRCREILNNYEEKCYNAHRLREFFAEHYSYKAIAKRIINIINGDIKADMDYYRSLW